MIHVWKEFRGRGTVVWLTPRFANGYGQQPGEGEQSTVNS